MFTLFGWEFGHDIVDWTVFSHDCLVEWGPRVLKPGQSLVVLIDTENAPRVLEAIQATQLFQLDGHRERQKNGVACRCGCTGGTIGIFLLHHHLHY